MKILMVNSSDIKGGAARAAYRLHRGLNEQGIESQMLVKNKSLNDPSVISPYNSYFGEVIGKIRSKANTALQKLQITENLITHSSNFLPSGLHKKINNSDADIVHLHWLGGEMLSISEISKIKKPIVWTLHDMWAFSGAEHYDDLNSPERYKKGYCKSNRPTNHKGFDLDRWTWNRKMKYWISKDFNIVTPSTWLANCAEDSPLFKNQKIQVIHNGLDLDVYQPIPKEWAQKILNVPQDEETKFILFGALSAMSDERKGYKQLQKALSRLKNKNYRLLIFGSQGYEDINFSLPTTYLGKLNDDETLALAYSAANVMVIPSQQDNLPNTAIEAVACGSPIVAFTIGGLPDIIDHKENGYLAEPYSSKDLAEGINWTLEGNEQNEQLCKRARKKAIEKFSINKISREYIRLYEEIITQ